MRTGGPALSAHTPIKVSMPVRTMAPLQLNQVRPAEVVVCGTTVDHPAGEGAMGKWARRANSLGRHRGARHGSGDD